MTRVYNPSEPSMPPCTCRPLHARYNALPHLPGPDLACRLKARCPFQHSKLPYYPLFVRLPTWWLCVARWNPIRTVTVFCKRLLHLTPLCLTGHCPFRLPSRSPPPPAALRPAAGPDVRQRGAAEGSLRVPAAPTWGAASGETEAGQRTQPRPLRQALEVSRPMHGHCAVCGTVARICGATPHRRRFALTCPYAHEDCTHLERANRLYGNSCAKLPQLRIRASAPDYATVGSMTHLAPLHAAPTWAGCFGTLSAPRSGAAQWADRCCSCPARRPPAC